MNKFSSFSSPILSIQIQDWVKEYKEQGMLLLLYPVLPSELHAIVMHRYCDSFSGVMHHEN